MFKNLKTTLYVAAMCATFANSYGSSIEDQIELAGAKMVALSEEAEKNEARRQEISAWLTENADKDFSGLSVDVLRSLNSLREALMDEYQKLCIRFPKIASEVEALIEKMQLVKDDFNNQDK